MSLFSEILSVLNSFFLETKELIGKNINYFMFFILILNSKLFWESWE